MGISDGNAPRPGFRKTVNGHSHDRRFAETVTRNLPIALKLEEYRIG
jgi:hypothetical protein